MPEINSFVHPVGAPPLHGPLKSSENGTGTAVGVGVCATAGIEAQRVRKVTIGTAKTVFRFEANDFPSVYLLSFLTLK